mgnify:CR=1 FL=1
MKTDIGIRPIFSYDLYYIRIGRGLLWMIDYLETQWGNLQQV